MEGKLKSMTCVLVWAVLASSIGSGFQHGYNTGVLNAPQKVIETWMNETWHMDDSELTIIWSTTTSIMCIGGIIGGALTSLLSNWVGRRKTLILNNFIAAAAGIIMGGSKYINQPWMLILGRFIIGINAGLNAGVGPMYLSEISPMGLRGAIGSMYQLVITISILIAQVVSINKALGTDTLWPILLFLILIPAAYQILGMLTSPESPKYLLEKDEHVKALSESVRLFGDEGGPINLEHIKNEIEDARSLPNVTMRDMIYVAKYRRPLIIMCLLMGAQQMSGINAVIYYSTQIFKTADLSEENAQIATIGVGLVNVITTIFSVFLVEMVGRKPLLIIGFAGMTVDLTLLLICLYYVETNTALAYTAVVLVYLFIILFAIGAGSIPWIMGSELFATAARPLGLSVAVPANWFFNFIVGLIFLPLQKIMGPAVFLIFIVSQALATVYFLVRIPETKNRPIDEITALFE
ncbi:transporter [Nesidiocoris tenuis]|uniref:Transporter n=1 Tax=Nesidiocoris tenuis TaxID=355587 RepID=A0ABN7AAP3_9HEMI|nr:transporter [Nesidiocoris tenuis]